MNTRRNFLKSGGALLIGFPLANLLSDQASAQTRVPTPGPPAANQIDTWLAIHSDNTATFYVGFAELGQGNSTALLQIAAEELDLDLTQIATINLDTHVTPNQGGTYSSASIARGGPQVRTAAAEARQALLKLAAARLNAPVDQLRVERGIVWVNGALNRTVTYGALIGDQQFNVAFTGNAPVKNSADYKLVGKALSRKDTPAKVSGDYSHLQHLRLPGMLHARVVRPRGQRAYGAGAKIISVNEDSIKSILGARVVRKGDFLGVVANTEWDAVKAAAQLQVTWDNPPALPGNDRLFAQMRAEKTEDRVVLERGDIAAAFTGAAHVVSRTVRGPYQMHAPFAPNGALADVTADSAHIITSSQDVYATRRTLARILGLAQEKIRVQYAEGSGTYGHSCYDDVAQAAALISQLAGKPVRLQFMRWDEHGWDLYGPAHIGEVHVAADAQGRLRAYEYHGWQHNWSNVETSEQLTGVPAAEWPGAAAQQVSPLNLGSMYVIPNLKLVNHKINVQGYLRAAWLRSPLDLSFSFASEQAIDQLAYDLNQDPYRFRLANMTDERWLGVMEAVARIARWDPRRANATPSNANVVTGRGLGLGTHLQSWGAAVAEIEINRQTGKVLAKHLYGALDCGQCVNPGIVESQISGQLVQTASRMLLEEVKFNQVGVTSLDWNTYPVMRFEECPDTSAVVVQRLNEKSSGAGEETMAACAAAIANAFFDATGVRMEEYPLTPSRVLAALKR
ncbi:MAG: molybdopterin cofactor-binding domain-containing protein [Acidobacteriota bacterium]